MTPGKFWGLRRLAAPDGTFRMLAVDQRPPIKQLVARNAARGASKKDALAQIKATLLESLAPHASASLADPAHGLAPALHLVPPATGLIATLEDSAFRTVAGERKSAPIKGWSALQIRRAGADAVKALAWYHPGASDAVRKHQQDFVRAIGQQCAELDIPFVFELLRYRHGSDAIDPDSPLYPVSHAEEVVASVREFAHEDYGIDLFKLESPWPTRLLPDFDDFNLDAYDCRDAFEEIDAVANRPWVLLSAGSPRAKFELALRYAYEAGASGFLAGRTIWWEAAQAWPDMELMRKKLAAASVPYMRRINKLTAAHAKPWTEHRAWSSGGLPPRFADMRSDPTAG